MVVVAFLVALDLWSKAAVWPWLTELLDQGALDRSSCTHGHARYVVVDPWLGFMLNLNPGAAFGMFDGVPHLLVGGRAIAVLLLTWLIWRAPVRQPAYLTSLVLILSGALGNLYDNLAKPIAPLGDSPYGPVRDFIDVYFLFPSLGLDEHFPTFNVADSCISVGAVLLLVSGLVADWRAKRAASADAANEEPSAS